MKVYVGLLFFFVLCNEQIVHGYRILGLIPLHGRSHFIVATALMKGLAERGHQVDVVSHFPLKNPIPNYRDISLKGSLPAAMNNLTASEIAEFSATFSFWNLVDKTGNGICELMNLPQMQELIKNPPKDPPYDIVITELFMSPCYLAFGRHLNATMVGLVASAFHDWLNQHVGNPHNPSYIPSLFSSFTQNMNFWERLANTLQSHLTIGQISYLMEKQSVYVERFFGSQMPSISELYKDLALVLVNSHHSLNGLRPMTNAVVEVGGIHVRDTEDPFSPELKKWLDESKDGVVVFTLGSMARVETFPKRIVEAFYAAFKRIAPVKVLMKVAKPEDLIPGLPKNVRNESWLPQLAVLKHPNVRAFITHGGLMGTTEAVYCGVPMIGIPLFGDQSINIQNYVNKKIAVSLGDIYDLTEEKIVNALNTVLKDPQYRENIKSLSKRFMDRPMKPIDEAVYWVEYVGRHGNILQSPAVHLTWWQHNLVDVYGFILLCLAVVLYVLYFILKTLKNCLCGSKKCIVKSAKSNKKKE